MEKMIQESEEYLIHSYNRYPIVLDHGEDVYLVDKNGKKYLDFGGGIAVCCLGYSNEEFKNALKEQIDKGIHYSNFFYSEPLMKAVKALAKASRMDKVFMANSGTEANEGALKLARKYAILKGHENRHQLIAMNKAFHGRSMGALSVTGTAKYRQPFEPMLPGVSFAEYNDLDSVEKLITEDTYAIILEGVQGEGGIHPGTKEFLQGVRRLCTKHDIMMIMDEIQCGMGRTGKMFAYQQYGIRPDIVTMAKGIGNGIVVGAFAARTDVAKALVPGDHGTTFGGNPLASAAVVAVNHIFKEKNILENVNRVGEYLGKKLDEIAAGSKVAKEARGMGLMRGLECDAPVGEICAKALDKGLLLLTAGTNVIRFVPPLVIKEEHVDQMAEILTEVLKEFE